MTHIAVLGTGGTIAGSAAAAGGRGYVSGVVPISDLVDELDLRGIAEVSSEQLDQVDSVELTLADQVRIAARVHAMLADESVDGVVVTHGTDTLEETAYLLHLLLATTKPVVVVGAMRPADAPGADGPANLTAAITVAASPESRGRGTLVVCDGGIYCARDVTKSHTARVGAFTSPSGPIGEVDSQVRFLRTTTRCFGESSALTYTPRLLEQTPPMVELLVGHAGMPSTLVNALIEARAEGIVYVGHGAGNVPRRVSYDLDRARRAGVVVVRSTRVGAGAVVPGGHLDDRHEWVASGDLGPIKARILLCLCLLHRPEAELAWVREIFATH